MPQKHPWRVCQTCAQQWQRSLRQRHSVLHTVRKFSNAPSRCKDATSKPSVNINYFEQRGPSKKDLHPIPEKDFDDNDEVTVHIKARIKELENQLKSLESAKEENVLSEEDKVLLEKVYRGEGLTQAEMKSALKDSVNVVQDAVDLGVDPDELEFDQEEMKSVGLDAEDGLETMQLESMQFELPRALQESLDKLVSLLREADHTNDSRHRIRLWRQYLKCKDQLPGFEEQLPKPAWDLLWNSQYELERDDESRLENLRIAADDMAKTGQELTIIQIVTRIEGFMSDSSYEQALKLWHDTRQTINLDDEMSAVFLDLGPAILSLLNRSSDAQSLALELSSSDARVNTFVPVIEAWIRSGTKNSSGKAWWLYLKLKELFKGDLPAEAYDKLVMTFFNAGQQQLALSIFKDLVLASKSSSNNSLQLQQNSSDLYTSLSQQAPDANSLNDFSLKSIVVLPRSFQNKFFYAMWMKRLIGLNEIEAAGSVLELMYYRGLRADARHVNGLISALLRRGRPASKDGRPADKDIALETAWSMIRERQYFVARRRALQAGQNPPPVPDDPARHLPPYLGKNLPPATVETFSILLLYYSRSNIQASVEEVHTALIEAEVAPNIYYLNHLLYMHLRRGNRSSLWTLFLSATDKNNKTPALLSPHTPRFPITPDTSTFACLWEASTAHVTANPAMRRALHDQYGVHFPGPRKLFNTTASWLRSLSSKEHAQALADFDHDMYAQVLRSFALARDLPGTLIALYALRELFGAYPNADDLRLVSIELARSNEPNLQGWKKRRVGRFGDKKGSQAQLVRVSELVDIVREERAGALRDMGVREDQLDEEHRGEEALWVLGQLLRMVMQSKRTAGTLRFGPDDDTLDVSPEKVDGEVEKIAWRMGVGSLSVGAALYEVRGGKVELVGFEGQVIRDAPEDGVPEEEDD